LTRIDAKRIYASKDYQSKSGDGMTAYRVSSSITAILRRGQAEQFRMLNRGAIVIPVTKPNSAGMLEARCEENSVVVFQRDLEDASERIEIGTTAVC
jgi:hypothetical protein